MFIFFN